MEYIVLKGLLLFPVVLICIMIYEVVYDLIYKNKKRKIK